MKVSIRVLQGFRESLLGSLFIRVPYYFWNLKQGHQLRELPIYASASTCPDLSRLQHVGREAMTSC